MIDPITGAGLAEALTAINAAMQGQTLADEYNRRITGRYPTYDGPTIGFTHYTTDTPAISGDTSGTISNGSGNTPVDAWNDYVENENADVSDTTGGIVSGSKVGTFVYSIMEENPGTATAAVKAIVPVAVPLDAAITAISQAAGVSMDAANLDAETKQTLVNSYIATSGVIYDKARELVTAWKDELGRILFPKRAFDAISSTIDSMGIGQGGGAEQTSEMSDYYGFELPAIPISTVFIEGPWAGTAVSSSSVSTDNEYPISSYKYENQSDAIPPSLEIFSLEDLGARITWYRKIGEQITQFTASRNTYQILRTGQTVYRYSLGYGYASDTYSPPPAIIPNISGTFQAIMDIVVNGTISSGGYPEGTSASEADKYTPSTIPIAGNLATSYDPDTGVLGTEPLVPIHLTDDPYDTTGDTTNPTDPTDEDNPGVANPPIPLPIPDTKPSNPDVPLVNPSVIDSTRIDELVEELANTLDPQPGQSSGIIPVPPLPGITDPETGQTTFPSIIPESGPGFIHVYNPTPAEFVAFGSWLWVTYADATIDKILNNPFDGVIGAHELYATPNRGGTDNIRSAFLVCPTTAALVPNRYSEIDCGTVIVPEFYGNYLDYSPYSQAYIYLPFIGINEVSIDDIVGHAVNIRYRVDSYSGSCIAMIFVAKDGYQNLCYQFAGSCSVEVPMAGGSQAAIKAGMMQAEAYARAAMVSAGGHLLGGIGSALMGSLGGALSSVAGIAGDYANAKAGVEAARVANKSSVQHSGQFGASHGAMGQKIPFIIIRNPIQVKVVNYNDDYGYPAHKRVIIGGCTGYLRVREVNVISAHATDDEKAAIEALLKNGVYVS